MLIKFLGASKTVTGSCYLVTTKNSRFLIDCGMFQGPEVEKINFDSFKFDPSTIDFVILTHAHLDHCGLLPKLVKEGFSGTVFSTPYTFKISQSILLDSAKLQANYNNRYNSPQLYNTSDALNVLNKFVTHDTDKEIVHNDVKFIFRKASHILGAVSIEIYNGKDSITFSGDLGRCNDQLIGQYSNLYKTTSVYVMESLYGDSDHQSIQTSNSELLNILHSTFSRNGIVMIPVFAVHRSLLMISILQDLINQKLLDTSTKIVLDSPLAESIARVYSEYNSRLDLSQFNNLIYKKRDLKKNNKSSKRIILAGGGMANGGRILSYFKQYISSPRNSVVFVGFQAEETLGRSLTEGIKTISIDENSIPVLSEIYKLDGYSAHADKSELLWWISRFDMNIIKKVFLVHAEESKSISFKNSLQKLYPNLEIIIPEMYHEENLV